MFNLTKKRIILYAIGLAMAWGAIITFFAEPIMAMPFYIQFALATAAGYLFPSIIIGHSFESKINKKIVGAWFFLMGTDLMLPPLAVGLDGNFIASGLFSQATPDKMLYEIWTSVGIPSNLTFFAVYPLGFILAITIAVALLNEKQIWKIANGN